MDVDASTYPFLGSRAKAVRDRVAELVNLMTQCCKRPASVRLNPGHYHALTGAVNRDLRNQHRERIRQTNEELRAKGQKKLRLKDFGAPDKVERLHYAGIWLERGAAYHKPRKFEP